jgi:hypothetical protein
MYLSSQFSDWFYPTQFKKNWRKNTKQIDSL